MTVLLAFIAGSVVTGTAVDTWHRFRRETLAADVERYGNTRRRIISVRQAVDMGHWARHPNPFPHIRLFRWLP